MGQGQGQGCGVKVRDMICCNKVGGSSSLVKVRV